jgi:hypothetical protein
MTPVLVVIIAALVAALTALRARERARRDQVLRSSPKRVVLPFLGAQLSRRSLDAALRLARGDAATLVPVYLARVPYALSLDAPLPRQCTEALPLLEAIEQRATAHGVPVDSRIERGRDARHALRELVDHERYDRLVIAASPQRAGGFGTSDVSWLLEHAPGEILVLRPSGDDEVAV